MPETLRNCYEPEATCDSMSGHQNALKPRYSKVFTPLLTCALRSAGTASGTLFEAVFTLHKMIQAMATVWR